MVKRKTPLSLSTNNHPSPLVALTAYTTPMARILDKHCDILLVGDSLGMVVYGLPTTVPVTMDMMINHGAAVVRGSEKACVVVDLPFGSYQQSPQQAFKSATRILQKTHCSAVKLEGGAEMAETVEFLSTRGIPVMGHIGLTPQHYHTMGGFRVQGKDKASAKKLIQDAMTLEKAGAFAIVVEGVPSHVAMDIRESISIPTIGIGAGEGCDGQILVTEDLLGMFPDFTPKFVKKYDDLSSRIDAAVEQYAKEVREETFPSIEHQF